MRGTTLPILAFPLLLTYCGSKYDLIIGEIAITGDPGTSGSPGSGTGAEPNGGGSGGVGAMGGSTAVGGSEGGTAGTSSEGGAAGASGEGGAAGASDCIDGEGPPLDSLIHRYSFEGTGNIATDSISGADGTLQGGAMLDGNGVLVLPDDAGSGPRVDLPDGLVSSLTDLTVVVWMTWAGGAGYTRVFDFGISSAGEGQGTSGTNYIAVMAATGFEDQESPGLGAEIKASGHPTIHLPSKEDVTDRAAQVGFVFRSGVNAELYLDATLLSNEPTDIRLADIDDRNNWIGQSQWVDNHNFEGTINEVRIYDVALNACQIHSLLVRGPQMPW